MSLRNISRHDCPRCPQLDSLRVRGPHVERHIERAFARRARLSEKVGQTGAVPGAAAHLASLELNAGALGNAVVNADLGVGLRLQNLTSWLDALTLQAPQVHPCAVCWNGPPSSSRKSVLI